jgi:hypothetical protein
VENIQVIHFRPVLLLFPYYLDFLCTKQGSSTFGLLMSHVASTG